MNHSETDALHMSVFAAYGQRETLVGQRSAKDASDIIANAKRTFLLCSLELSPSLSHFGHELWMTAGGGSEIDSAR
jgi:hypothetical protein